MKDWKVINMIIDSNSTNLDVKKSKISFKVKVEKKWLEKGYSVFWPGSDFCFLEIFNDCNYFRFYIDLTYDCKCSNVDLFLHDLLSATLYSFRC